MTANRKTAEKKTKAIITMVTEDEHIYFKGVATERGWSMTRLNLSALRYYIRHMMSPSIKEEKEE